jgi:hypothetical protein
VAEAGKFRDVFSVRYISHNFSGVQDCDTGVPVYISKLVGHWSINPLTPELNPSAQRCLPRFFTGILIFKGLIARRFYKSFGVKGLIL